MAMNVLNRFNDKLVPESSSVYMMREKTILAFICHIPARILQGVNTCATLSDSSVTLSTS